MCGFGGYFSPVLKNKYNSLFHEMPQLLKHRGGDSSGFYENEILGAVHQRLAIRGINGAGAQPIVDNLGNVLVYNGEIYNVEHLAGLLDLEESVWKNSSDTEILFKFLIQFGCDRISQVEGTFSFAFYSTAEREISLVRDRLGIKPLFYSYDENRDLYFCSEILPLLKTFRLEKDVCEQALVEYIWFGSNFEDRTIFKSIKSVLPGEIIVHGCDQISKKYWYRLEEDISKKPSSTLNNKTTVNSAIKKSVERQMVSDVPMSLFLSSGVDSNIVLYEASKIADKEFKAYTARFKEGVVNESPLAEKHSVLLGVTHKQIDVDISVVERSVRDLVKVYGEPFGDAAAIPLFEMCKKLRRTGRKVVLQGDGADELFRGYLRYIMFNKPLLTLLQIAFRLVPKIVLNHHVLRRFKRWVEIISSPSEVDRYALALTLHSKNDDPVNVFELRTRSSLKERCDPFLGFRNASLRFQGIKDPSKKLALMDMVLQLPSQFLPKVDRASMAANVEARVPMLDEIVLRAALPIPSSKHISFLGGKRLLRKAYASIIPKFIMHRAKLGFSTPYKQWVDEMINNGGLNILTELEFCSQFKLSSDYITKILTKENQSNSDYFLIWKLYILYIWHDEVVCD